MKTNHQLLQRGGASGAPALLATVNAHSWERLPIQKGSPCPQELKQVRCHRSKVQSCERLGMQKKSVNPTIDQGYCCKISSRPSPPPQRDRRDKRDIETNSLPPPRPPRQTTETSETLRQPLCLIVSLVSPGSAPHRCSSGDVPAKSCARNGSVRSGPGQPFSALRGPGCAAFGRRARQAG